MMYKYRIALLVLLMALVGVSCDDQITDNEQSVLTGKENSITFSLKGLDSFGISTRSNEHITDIDFARYEVRLLVFKGGTSDYGTFTLDREAEKINTSVVGVNDIESDHYYLYVFLAVPSSCLSDAEKEDDYMGIKTGIATSAAPTVGTTSADACYIPVFQEPEYDEFNFCFGAYGEDLVPRTGTGNDEFMIYGWSMIMPPNINSEGVYTPQDVTLTPQLGAIVFDTQGIGEGVGIQSCRIYSNFYRFYLSQMKGDESTSFNKIPAEPIGWDDEITCDLMGNFFYYSYITYEFTQPAQRVHIYVPCTAVSDTDKKNGGKANTVEGTLGDGVEDNDATSITTTDGKSYSTKEAFAVYPMRTTVLKINDGSLIPVGINDGINLEDEKWDGLE